MCTWSFPKIPFSDCISFVIFSPFHSIFVVMFYVAILHHRKHLNELLFYYRSVYTNFSTFHVSPLLLCFSFPQVIFSYHVTTMFDTVSLHYTVSPLHSLRFFGGAEIAGRPRIEFSQCVFCYQGLFFVRELVCFYIPFF